MPMTYSPRAQSFRYRNADCPKNVLAIYDNGGTSADRYTVIYKTLIEGPHGQLWLGLRAMNAQPSHPQYGIALYAQYRVHEIAAYRDRSRRHACRWTDLPPTVQACVRLDCTPLPS